MSIKNKRSNLTRPPRDHVRLSYRLDALAADMAAAPDADTGPKWVQVAQAGDYKGYAGGAFVFDEKVFKQIIANFRAHPSYAAGADGVGSEEVIPWDFNHASASFAADGTIPITGTPAQGWILDLKTAPGANGVGLWALTNWLEPARTYIKENRYKWASVVVGFDCRDQITNANIGAVLESVALTNNPFIEGMQKLVADRNGGARQGKNAMPGKQQAKLEYWYGRTASSPEDAFECLRSLFGLPQTADVGAVLGELLKLQTWATSGGAPIGVDLDELVSSVRTIFNLPALASTEDVFAETSKLLGSLLEQQTLEDNETEIPAEVPPANEVPPAAAAMERKDMSLIKIIASRLGVQETEAAATAALEGLFTLRALLAKSLGLTDHVNDKVLLDAAGGASDARSKLSALMAALGIEDSNAAVDKIAGLMKQAAELEAAMPELKSLREAAAAGEAKSGEEEVDKVMNSKGYTDAGVRLALTSLRKSDKAGFQKQYAEILASKPAEGAAAGAGAGAGNMAYLSTNLTGGAGGSERQIVPNKDGSVSLSAPGAGSKTGAPTGGKVRVDLSKQAGRNQCERAMSYIKASVAGANTWDFDTLWNAAVALIRESDIVDVAAAS